MTDLRTEKPNTADLIRGTRLYRDGALFTIEIMASRLKMNRRTVSHFMHDMITAREIELRRTEPRQGGSIHWYARRPDDQPLREPWRTHSNRELGIAERNPWHR